MSVREDAGVETGTTGRTDLLNMSAPDKTIASRLLIVFAAVFGIWHIVTNVYWNEPGLWQNAIHFAGFAFLAAITLSPFGRRANTPLAWTIDLIYATAVAASLSGLLAPRTPSMSAPSPSPDKAGSLTGLIGRPAES